MLTRTSRNRQEEKYDLREIFRSSRRPTSISRFVFEEFIIILSNMAASDV